MAEPSTDFVEPTDDIVTGTVLLLQNAQSSWDVQPFSGTSNAELFEYIPGLRLPAAVVAYRGSDWQNLPRRKLNLAVVIACQSNQVEEGASTVRGMLVVDALDCQIAAGAIYHVRTDEAVDVGPGIACHIVGFDVDDH
jgi:hypothetical protein